MSVYKDRFEDLVSERDYYKKKLNEEQTKNNKLDNALEWVFDHCFDKTDYAKALQNIGFSKKEIMDKLKECCLENKEIEEIIKTI